jgi:3-phenylpropionate/trans-cinnamate dioxygenase ferredoxin component
MAELLKVAKADELSPGPARWVEVHAKRLALFKNDGNFYALEDTCAHKGGPLSEGAVAGDQVTRPWHGAKFNIRSSEVLDPAARQNIARYNVRLTRTDTEIQV